MSKKMITAFVLITMQPGELEKAFKEMNKIENVKTSSVVAGEYDVVVNLNVKTLENLHEVTDKIRMIGGVEKTITHVVEKEISL